MIANVKVEGSWIRVYNHNNDRLSQMPYFNLNIVGVNCDFFVTQEGPWIITYDKHCHKIGQMLSKKVFLIEKATLHSFFMKVPQVPMECLVFTM